MAQDDSKLGESLIYFTWDAWGLFQSKAVSWVLWAQGRSTEGNEMKSVVKAVGTTAQMWLLCARANFLPGTGASH